MIILLCCRDYVERELVHYARANPGVVVYLKPRRHRAPAIKAEYCKFPPRSMPWDIAFTLLSGTHFRENILRYLPSKSAVPWVLLAKTITVAGHTTYSLSCYSKRWERVPESAQPQLRWRHSLGRPLHRQVWPPHQKTPVHHAHWQPLCTRYLDTLDT